MVSLEESKAREWSIIIFNNVWTLLSSYKVFLISKIHDLDVKISVLEKLQENKKSTSRAFASRAKKTLYELERVQTLSKMITDHSLALDYSRETKN